ncbi:MAG: anchor protein [Rariglobus sp.]|jgi:hypothetical protein|nr:anchor protein [Rariglobus sp.]
MRYLKSIAPVIALMILPSLSHAQVLLYNFDETGTTATNSGSGGTTHNLTLKNAAGTATDQHSASAGGVGGATGDRSFDLSAATGMGNSGGAWTGPYASSTTAGNVFNSASSFTIAGWYNAASAPAGGARLLQSSNLILFFNAGTVVLQTSATNTVTSVGTVLGSTATKVSSSGDTITTPAGQWVFLAVTFDGTGTNKTATFYQGSTSASASLSSQSVVYTTTNAALGNNATLSLGGNATSGSNVRPFDGLFDDIRVYASTVDGSGALGSSAINDIRLGAIPEPASYASIAGALLGFLALANRRSHRKAFRSEV